MTVSESYSRIARSAGIVGAGGAGFPMYVKLRARADTVIANGAECEPLLHKDKELMRARTDAVLRGLTLAGEAVGAKRLVISLKKKYADVVELVRKSAAKSGVEVHMLDNFYPSGDEYVLVYEAAGRLVPTGGIPLDVGCVVQNVETLANLADAVDDKKPVIASWVTVTGAVRHPATFRVAVGTPFRMLIEPAGGTTAKDPVILDGGAMMGRLVTDLETPVTKLTSGLLVLDSSHELIRRRQAPRKHVENVGLSACDQCYYCTEFCPRFLLGHPIEPHKVMRSLGFVGTSREYWSDWAAACCECNLCSLYACPEDLDPKNICTWAKSEVLKSGYRFPEPREVTVHPLADSRKVPLPKLIQRLGLRDLDHPAPFSDRQIEAPVLTVRLDQQRGAKATPLVRTGMQAEAGDEIASVPEEELGCPVHAPAHGVVREVTKDAIVIERI